MFTTQKKLALLICLLLFCSKINQVCAQSVEKQTVLAALALNLARYTHWPEQAFSHSELNLIMCVIGDNLVQQSFVNFDKKKVNEKTLHIINITRLRNLNQCHILYISKLNRSKLTLLLLELKGLPVLTVGEEVEFLKLGGMVALEKISEKIQLSINVETSKQSNLIISSQILKLAKIYYFPYPLY